VLRSVRRRISTINELLSMASWVNGVKTGHTFGARYVLVGSGRRKGVELIAAVVGTETDEERFDETLQLLEYGFSGYRKRVPIHAGQALATPSIAYSGGDLKLRAARTVAVGVRPRQRMSISVRAPQGVKGPIRRGARLGTAVVRVDGLRTASVPLLASRAVPKASTFERVRSSVEDNLLWIVLALSAILIAGALLRRRTR
jgi:D-alanyl-D-alanine carboxypeptidase (penicillin-binding protein 5/6)